MKREMLRGVTEARHAALFLPIESNADPTSLGVSPFTQYRR